MVEAAVVFFGVVFVKDGSVFEFCHFEVGGVSMFSHHESLYAVRLWRRVGVAVYGDEQVGVFLIGDLRSSEERDGYVAATSINDVDVRTVLLDVVAGFLCDNQSDVFFLRFLSYRTRVLATVTSVNDDGLYFSVFLSMDLTWNDKI